MDEWISGDFLPQRHKGTENIIAELGFGQISGLYVSDESPDYIPGVLTTHLDEYE